MQPQKSRVSFASPPGDDNSSTLTYGQIFVFWIPLAVMWLMMAVEQPAVTAVIARLPNPELNLASFGVMFSIALVIESPILQMLSAATARSRTLGDYRRLLRFMTYLAVVLTGVHLIVGLTPAYEFVVQRLIGVPAEVARHSRGPFLLMAPFSAAVGYRRLWQGVLIRYGRTLAVPVTMISRLLIAGAVLVIGYRTAALSGAAVAAITISAGVIVGAVTSYILFRKLVYHEMPDIPTRSSTSDLRDLLRFYVPLAMTSMVYLLSQPLVTFGIANAKFPLQSLAVWPVINGFMFLFNSFALSFQEAAIALLERGEENRIKLSRFSTALAIVLTSLLAVSALTPVSRLWFDGVSGLSDELLPFTRIPLLVLCLVPAMVTAKSWFRGQYVSSKRTSVLASAVVLYTAVLFLSVSVVPGIVLLPGAVLGAVCLAFAQFVENLFLKLNHPARQKVR